MAMKIHYPLTIALAVCLGASNSADAHFLFVRILPPAEGGRYAEVYFSDQADAGDPRFIDKIASTKLWLQTKPGSFEALKVHQTPDRLRALVPSNGSIAVIGECTYGVLARPKATPFRLRHYPKAIAGRPEEIRALQARPASVEEEVASDGLGTRERHREDETRHALGMVDGELLRDHAAHRDADHVRTRDPERVEETDRVLRHRGDRPGRRRRRAAPGAAIVERDHPVARRECLPLRRPRLETRAEARDQQERRTAPLFLVVECHAVRVD